MPSAENATRLYIICELEGVERAGKLFVSTNRILSGEQHIEPKIDMAYALNAFITFVDNRFQRNTRTFVWLRIDIVVDAVSVYSAPTYFVLLLF